MIMILNIEGWVNDYSTNWYFLCMIIVRIVLSGFLILWSHVSPLEVLHFYHMS